AFAPRSVARASSCGPFSANEAVLRRGLRKGPLERGPFFGGSSWEACRCFTNRTWPARSVPETPGSRSCGSINGKRTGSGASVSEAREWVEALKYDYWETEDYLTASLPLFRCERSRQERRPAYNRLLVFGACPDAVAMRGDLEKHPQVVKLYNLAADGGLRI